jgi:hypothetical protein
LPTGAEKTEMETALADLISKKHMGGAIEEIKVAGELMEETPAAAQAEEKVPPKPGKKNQFNKLDFRRSSYSYKYHNPES